MSQQIGGYPPATAPGSPAGRPTTQVTRDEATEVGRTAADAGRQVAGTAAEQAATWRRKSRHRRATSSRGPRPGPGPGPRRPAEGRRRHPGPEPGAAGDGRRRTAVRNRVGGRAAGRGPGGPPGRLARPAGARRPRRGGAVVRPPATRRVPVRRGGRRSGRRTAHPRSRGRPPGPTPTAPRSTSRPHRRTGHRRSRRRPTRPGSTCPAGAGGAARHPDTAAGPGRSAHLPPSPAAPLPRRPRTSPWPSPLDRPAGTVGEYVRRPRPSRRGPGQQR